MPAYRIDPRGSEARFESFEVEADSVEQAAQIAAQRVCHVRRGHPPVNAHRQTGVSGGSGVFQSYTRPNPKPGQMTYQVPVSAVGSNFHVFPIPVTDGEPRDA